MKKLEVKCSTKDHLPMEALRPFQGNLKNLDEASYVKLKANLLKQGFSFPIFVWSKDEDNYILDGHQRLRVLERLKTEGYQIPELPVVYVEADNYKAAKEKLLSAASQYGDFEPQGVYEFLTETEMDPAFMLENYKFGGMDFDSFMENYYTDPKLPDYGLANKELDEDEFSQFAHTCPKCGFSWDGDKKK